MTKSREVLLLTVLVTTGALPFACQHSQGQPSPVSPQPMLDAGHVATTPQSAGEQEKMDKVHYARPEFKLFLSKAASQMEAYWKKHGKYATDWNQLNFSFSARPYHLSDPGVFPPEGTGNRWQPKACRYTYVIKSSSTDQFLIQAINPNGVAEHEIRQGMDKPAPVTPK